MTRINTRSAVYRAFAWALPVLCLGLAEISRVRAADSPLHRRIDAALDGARVAPEPELVDDAVFLRRAFLDLTGRIPSSRRARAFLADASGDKRARLIDELLASPEHVRHMAITLDVTWIERRSDPHVKTDAWRDFLFSQFQTNTPYTTLASRVVAADGADAKNNGPAKFFLAREAEQHALTRDVSRMFFGKDVQCAQCHDHPRIEDYTMREYYGVNAFLNRTYLFRPDKKKPGVVGENPTGEANYKSVFTEAEGQSRPRLPGDLEITEPVVKKGDEYKVKPDKKNKNLRPIPAYSRRAQLARLFADGGNLQFRRNIVNRLWAHMMGRGIVEPVDFHHTDNPPTHPDLLNLLASEFANMNFDMRAFLRELALSRAYQRSFDLPSSLGADLESLETRLAQLDADYEAAAAKASGAVAGFERLKASISEKRAAIAANHADIDKREKAAAGLLKSRDVAKKAADGAAKPYHERRGKLESLAEAAAKAAQAAGALKEDKELAKAASLFEDRRAKLEAEVVKLKTEFDAKSAKLKAAEASLGAANHALRDLRSEAEVAAAELRKLQARFIDEDRKRADAKLRASRVRQQRDAARQLIETARLESQMTKARDQAGKARIAVEENGKLTEQLAVAVLALDAKLPSAQMAVDKALARKTEVSTATMLAADDLRETRKALTQANVGEPDKDGDPADALLKRKRTLEAELANLDRQSNAVSEEFLKAGRELIDLKAAIRDGGRRLEEAKASRPGLLAGLRSAEAKAGEAAAKAEVALSRLTDSLSARFTVGGLTPLSPEQLCWSMLQATGESDKQARAGSAEFDKKNPLDKGAEAASEREAAKATFVEQYVYGKLKGQESNFVSLFGSAAGSPQNAFFATPDQALFFANAGNVRGWLNPSGDNLTDRLGKVEDPEAFAEELYLSVLTREPTPVEARDVKTFLDQHGKDRKTAARELAWALLTSIEFRFRH